MVRKFTPRPWQGPMIEFGLDKPRGSLLARMGMGKSSATLAIADALLLSSTINKVLVTAPLRVARSTWPDERAKWEQFQHLKLQPIVGTADQRKEALRNDKADIYTVNYENLPWLVDTIGAEHWPFDMVVADEASKLRSFRLLQGGKRAQALAAVAHTKVRRWLNLSGSIAPNGLTNLWAPTWFVDRGARLGRSFDAFESRWFGYQRARDAVNAHQTRIQRIAFPHAQDEITGLIKDVSLAFNPKDWFPIKDPIVVPVYVDLPPEAKKRYREMERDLFTHIAGHDIEAFAASGKMLKCLAEGTEVLTDRGWVPIEHVTQNHRVWDGIEWVSTYGVVCQGYKEVVDCWGVSMTVDHKVMTVRGWLEAQEILDGESRGGHDRASVRLPYGSETRGGTQKEKQQYIPGDMALPMRLREGSGARWSKPSCDKPRETEVLRVPQRRNACRRVEHSRHDRAPCVDQLVPDEVPLHKPYQQRLAQLRRAWHHRLQTLARVIQKLLGRYGPNALRRYVSWPQEQRRELHAEKLPVGNRRTTKQQHAEFSFHRNTKRQDDCGASRTAVQRQEHHDTEALRTRLGGERRTCAAKVYDIVNAGPRHRFVVRGSAGNLLVHNCMQLSNGAIYTGSDEQVERDTAHWVPAHDEKLDALESIIEENAGETVLVAYHFKPDLARLKKRFPNGRHINTKADEDAFKRGEIELAFVHPQSIGHGVDGFQNVCHIIVFFAITFDLDPHDQIIERVGPMRQMQAGFDREVMVYLILARSTVDETIAERLVKKRGVQDATMDTLAYKPA